jgi:hypothetical protein
MKTWILLTVMSLLICGCTEVKYVKSGATTTDYETDKAECTQQMLMSASGAKLAVAESSGPYEKAIRSPKASASARQDIEQCLRSKGWALKSETE